MGRDFGTIESADLHVAGEVWMLEADHRETGAPYIVPPLDECGGARVGLVFIDREGAEAAAYDMLATYEIKCRVVKVIVAGVSV